MLHGSIFFDAAPTTESYSLSLHDALPISTSSPCSSPSGARGISSRSRAQCTRSSSPAIRTCSARSFARSEEHTSELQSRVDIVCRLLLEKKKDNCAKTIMQIVKQHEKPNC